MQAFALQPHPGTEDCPVTSIHATLSRAPTGALTLRYCIAGAIERLRVPAPRPSLPANGLWAHTCCEAFVGVAGSSAYREFNFAPSGEWAIYDFDDYRVRRTGTAALPAPAITLRREAGELLLEAAIDAISLPAGALLQLGLSAVIESTEGGLSYWALRHPAARPDFHHRDAFTLTLSQASR